MVRNRPIKLEAATTEIIRKVPKGCPQGGVLSPFLWNLVVDSLLKLFKKEHLQAFADDISSLNIGNDVTTTFEQTTRKIKEINEWCEKQGLKISALKTQVIYWTKTDDKHPNSIKVKGIDIPLSTSVKYLGVTIDNKLNWNEHIKNTTMKCKQALLAIKSAIGKKWGLAPSKMLWVYKTIIIPKLTYACAAWAIDLTNKEKQKLTNRYEGSIKQ